MLCYKTMSHHKMMPHKAMPRHKTMPRQKATPRHKAMPRHLLKSVGGFLFALTRRCLERPSPAIGRTCTHYALRNHAHTRHAIGTQVPCTQAPCNRHTGTKHTRTMHYAHRYHAQTCHTLRHTGAMHSSIYKLLGISDWLLAPESVLRPET